MRFHDARYMGMAVVISILLASSVSYREETVTMAPRTDDCDMTKRGLATADTGHPGNVFLAGEDVTIPAPAGTMWRALDEQGVVVGSGMLSGSGNLLAAPLGQRGIGWYKVEFLAEDESRVGWTTTAVLARQVAPVPENTPVCLDAALSWLSDDADERAKLARLATLAGVNWIRDRLHWRELQTGPDDFAPETKYDMASAMQSGLGLHVLQVFHTLPRWVVEDAPDQDPRCPDLRRVYAFCKAMSARFAGKVSAWEPWNEGNAGNFGGWTINELCSFQKAAFLGFKSGNPSVIVGCNPLGGANTESQAHGILANETWPYYDTYNIHSYDWPHAFETLWAPAREAACGRPIWVTESDRGIEHEVDSDAGDLSPEYDLRKAELIAQEYASSLYAGAARHFHFVLGDYKEGRIQFGLLRPDLTPRLSFAALAAVGRFLAGARCLGRWSIPDKPNAYAIVFRGLPDGVERDVIVAWTEEPVDWPQRGRASNIWELPEDIRVEAAFDYLGRILPAGAPDELRSAPVFLVTPTGDAAKLVLTPPPVSAYREGAASPVVLQLRWPEAMIKAHRNGWTDEYDYHAAPDSDVELQVYAYNFGKGTTKGLFNTAQAPAGWSLTMDHPEIELAPMERESFILRLHTGANPTPDPAGEWLRLNGDFGEAGRPALAFRVRTGE